MTESIVIGIFLLILLIIQIREQVNIVMLVKHSWIKLILSMLLAISVLIMFWPQQFSDQIKLISFSIMLASIGLLREGLAVDHLVKLGLFSNKYEQYTIIQLEENNLGETFVTFYKEKNNHFSMLFSEDLASVLAFFKKNAGNVELVVGELI